jgi:hypothetical protein
MDTRHITKGSVLYLPVQQAGALFSYGDAHAAQGDGRTHKHNLRARARRGLRAGEPGGGPEDLGDSGPAELDRRLVFASGHIRVTVCGSLPRNVCRNAWQTVVRYSEIVTEGTEEQDRGAGGMNVRVVAWVAWSLAALSVTMLVASGVLYVLAHSAQFPVDWVLFLAPHYKDA